MKKRSSLTNPNVAIDRQINNSAMDTIESVNAHIAEIEAIGTVEVLADIAAIADLDFSAVLAGVDVVENLTVSVVETLPAGSQATAALVGTEIQLRIPKGVDGTNGYDGVTPQFEFSYNSSTGNLEYELAGYIDINTGNIIDLNSPIEEW